MAHYENWKYGTTPPLNPYSALKGNKETADVTRRPRMTGKSIIRGTTQTKQIMYAPHTWILPRAGAVFPVIVLVS